MGWVKGRDAGSIEPRKSLGLYVKCFQSTSPHTAALRRDEAFSDQAEKRQKRTENGGDVTEKRQGRQRRQKRQRIYRERHRQERANIGRDGQKREDQRQRRAKEGREDTEKRHKMSALDEYQCKVREGTDKSEVSHRHLSTVLKQT